MKDTNAIEQKLRDREQELLSEISRLENQARDARSAEVEDPIDSVISSEGKAAAFGESTIAAQTLSQVRQALQRLKDGTYGVCIDCGRPIEPARLNAVPWTPYCREDQEKHDQTPTLGVDSDL
jgi:DnaK suppressor protein